MRLRVGIDGRYLQDHFPGIGRYTFHLIKELALVDGPECYVVFCAPSAVNSRFDLKMLEGPRVSLSVVDVPPLSLRSQTALPEAIRRERLNVFHCPHYPVPLLASCPLLTTVHDTIPLRDPFYLPSGRSRLAYRLAIFFALTRSKAVIADSMASREDLVRFLRIVPYKIKTVYLGVDMPETTVPEEQSGQCVLYVGTNKPHKNLPRLVKAYARARLDLPLVIAGEMDPRYPEAQRQVELLGLTGRVHFLGYVAEQRLRQLYQTAALFVFPSLAEGFGLPVLEAMAHGVPVVTSNHPAITEVVGDAALQVDPLDIESLASAMATALADRNLARALSFKGRGRAALFPWSKTAQGCARLYREAAGLT